VLGRFRQAAIRADEEMVVQVSAQDIVEIIVKETGIPAEKLEPDASLEALQIESIDMVSVIFAVEDRYGISITNEEAAEAGTLGHFVDIIAAKAAAKPAPDPAA
jgi:acyl carrier protein